MGIIIDYAQKLSEIGHTSGYGFEVQPIPGEVEVLEITVEDREELPIFLSAADSHILCITYLWREEEVIAEKKPAMIEAMLTMNIAMPLSSFAKLGDQYVIFGALSRHSSLDEIVQEISVLSDNSLEVIKIMSEYLK